MVVAARLLGGEGRGRRGEEVSAYMNVECVMVTNKYQIIKKIQLVRLCCYYLIL